MCVCDSRRWVRAGKRWETHCFPDIAPVNNAHYGPAHACISISSPNLRRGRGRGRERHAGQRTTARARALDGRNAKLGKVCDS